MARNLAPLSDSSFFASRQYGQYDLEKTATGFSSMMDCTFVLVADMVAGLGARVKKWRRKEMVAVGWGVAVLAGDVSGDLIVWCGVGEGFLYIQHVCICGMGGGWDLTYVTVWIEVLVREFGIVRKGGSCTSD